MMIEVRPFSFSIIVDIDIHFERYSWHFYFFDIMPTAKLLDTGAQFWHAFTGQHYTFLLKNYGCMVLREPDRNF